jgi:hypothetical protein
MMQLRLFVILRPPKLDPELWLIGLGIPLAIAGLLIATMCIAWSMPPDGAF